MDARLLDPDEFALECDLRSIGGEIVEQMTLLSLQLDDEANGVRAIPDKTHDSAYHNPDRELRKCQQKLNEHSEWFKRVKDTDPSPEDLARTESRLLHVQARLIRLKRSRAYGCRAAELAAHATDLLMGVQAWIQDGKGRLNDTIDKICASTPYAVGNVTDSEEDDASSDENESDDNTGSRNKSTAPISTGQMGCHASSPVTSGPEMNQCRAATTSNIANSYLASQAPGGTVPSGRSQSRRQVNEPSSIPPTGAIPPVKFQPDSLSQNSARIETRMTPRVPLTAHQILEQLHPVLGAQQNVDALPFIPNRALPTLEEIQTGPAISRPSFQMARPASNFSNMPPEVSNANYRGPIPPNVDSLFRIPPPPINRTRSQMQVGRDHQGLSRAKLGFDGSPGGIPIESFLFRLERTADNLGMVRDLLVDEIACVLKGVAQEWYWCHLELNPVMTWNQLRADIIARFQDRRTPFDIRRSIENRKQLRNESIIEFYNAIRALTLQSRVAFPEAEILHYVRSNMRSGLQLALADRNFNSINELLQCCIALEDTWTRLKHVPEPSFMVRRQVNELNLMSGEPGVEGSQPVEIPESHPEDDNYTLPTVRPSVSALETSPSHRPAAGRSEGTRKNHNQYSQNNSPLYYCWNCHKPDHGYQDCLLPPQRIFCYGCGRVGVVKPMCFKCSPGNSIRGNRRFGNPISPQVRQDGVQEDAATNTDPELYRRQH